MSKSSLSFGKFIQLNKTFLTDNQDIICRCAGSPVYMGETLYFTQPDCLVKYSEGKIQKLSYGFSALFKVGDELYAAADTELYRLKDDQADFIHSFPTEITDMTMGRDGSVWLIDKKDLYRLIDGEFSRVCYLSDNTACLAVFEGGERYAETVYTGTSDAGLMALKGKRRHWAELMAEVTGIPSNRVNCISFDHMGYLWVGTDKGLAVYDGKNHWLDGNTVYSLPTGSFNDMYFAPNGKKYFATSTGVITLIEGRLSYYSYGAWLSDPDVTAIAASDSGQIAAVTKSGITIISPCEMTLGEKAEYFDKLADKYFVRKDGFNVSRSLKIPGDPDSGVLYNSDNDGLWTGMYCASQCFRYAVTREQEALKNARRAINAMLKLTRVSGKRGFTARAIRYRDEDNFGTGPQDEWHICEDDPNCEWLGETSSDEMTGHFFAYGLYYDLCADKEEKEKIAAAVLGICDHIMENNFHLSDVDGVPTTWANWDPHYLNGDDKWFYERGTNSLQIITFLRTAYHMSGDEKYNEVCNALLREHHYGMNVMQYKVEDAHIAHIDDQLDFLNIYHAIEYTENPGEREIIKMGLTHHWEYERIERSPLFNIVYGSLTHNPCDIEKAAVSLSEMSLDMIRRPVYNSYRKDIAWDTEQEARGLPRQLKEPVEYHSRFLSNYDTNPFICDSGCEDILMSDTADTTRLSILPGTRGADGKSMMSPMIYLLPYWMARYHGLITD